MKITKEPKLIFLFVFYLILLLFILYLSGIVGVFQFVLEMLIYGFVFYGLSYLYKKIRKKEITSLLSYFRAFYYRLAWLIIVLVVIIFIFSFYNNEIRPLSTPQYIISNGDKTVVFQTMMHIATTGYYEKVKSDLILNKENAYVLFFEGVIMDDEANAMKFNQLMGVDFDKDFYKNFSKLYGLVNQDNESFLGLVNTGDINVDVTISKVIELYEEKYGEIVFSTGDMNEIMNVNDSLIARLAQLNERQLKLFRYFNKALVNALTKNQYFIDNITQYLGKQNLMSIILDERNKVLAQAIEKTDYKKIHVLYGMLHFEGTLALLKQSDPNWKIVEKKEVYPTR